MVPRSRIPRSTSLFSYWGPKRIRSLNIFGKFPVDMRIPRLNIKILLESNPLKSRILVRRSAVSSMWYYRVGCGRVGCGTAWYSMVLSCTYSVCNIRDMRTTCNASHLYYYSYYNYYYYYYSYYYYYYYYHYHWLHLGPRHLTKQFVAPRRSPKSDRRGFSVICFGSWSTVYETGVDSFVSGKYQAYINLEGNKGVPRNGGRNNWFDRVLPSIPYMFKPSC